MRAQRLSRRVSRRRRVIRKRRTEEFTGEEHVALSTVCLRPPTDGAGKARVVIRPDA